MRQPALHTIGTIFLVVSLGAAAEQPVLLVISIVAAGVLAGVGGHHRAADPVRPRAARARGPYAMRGAITTSGSGWANARHVRPTVQVLAIRTYRAGKRPKSVVVARTSANATVTRNGDEVTFRFSAAVPIIDTSEGRFSWNVRLETLAPKYRATFLVDVA